MCPAAHGGPVDQSESFGSVGSFSSFCWTKHILLHLCRPLAPYKCLQARVTQVRLLKRHEIRWYLEWKQQLQRYVIIVYLFTAAERYDNLLHNYRTHLIWIFKSKKKSLGKIFVSSAGQGCIYFTQKYRKISNIVKYYCNFKYLISIWI